jgi:rod shape-determining protein MreD
MLGLIAIGVTAVIAVVLQSTVFARLHPFTGAIPNLMLILVVVLGVRHQGAGGALAAFVLGYVLDTFVGTMLGLHALAFTLVYAGVVLIGKTVHADRGASAMLVVFLAGCLHAVVTVSVTNLCHGGLPIFEGLRRGVAEAAVTCVLTPAVLALVAWQERLLGANA